MKRDILAALTLLTLIAFAMPAFAASIPSVTGVSPNIGSVLGGQTVTITGSGFTDIEAVYFQSIDDSTVILPASFSFKNDNSITVVTPDARTGMDKGYGIYDIRVRSAVPPTEPAEGRTSPITVSDRYTFVPAAVVNEVSPSAGDANGGTVVTLAGSDFTGADKVYFGDKVGTKMVVDDDSQITVTAPPGPLGQTVPVVVTHSNIPGPTSATATYTWITIPSVSKINPNSGSVGGGNTVTITGKYFTGTTSVKFGNTEATSFNTVNDNKITAVVPAGTGKVDVQVTNAIGPSDTATSKDDYTYVQVPIITSITPTSGSYLGSIIDSYVHPNADIIDILGYGFTGASQVAVGPNVVLAKDFISITDNKISIYAPALNKNPYQPGKPKTVDIQVTAAGGISNSGKYTYIAVPKIYSLSPSKGPTNGGTAVTINGIGLTGTSKVTFGDGWNFADEATITSVTDTQVKILTPQEDAGSLQVVATSTGGISSLWQSGNGNVFTYTGLPVVNSIAPLAGPTTGGTKVTITGENLKEVQKVMFGPNAATAIKVVNPTKIIATSPAETAGTVDVTVVSPSGTSPTSDNDKFTYQQVKVTPTVTKVAPNSGIYTGGNTVTVYGSGFTGATLVNFGGKSGSKLAVTSDTKLTVTAPAGTGTVDITVVTPGGASPATSKDRYTYLLMPVVSSVSPTSGTVKGGNTVLIYGTNFKETKAVYFGNMKVTKLSVNAAGTRVTLKAPAGIGKGTVDVTVLTSVGKSATSTADKYTYT